MREGCVLVWGWGDGVRKGKRRVVVGVKEGSG